MDVTAAFHPPVGSRPLPHQRTINYTRLILLPKCIIRLPLMLLHFQAFHVFICSPSLSLLCILLTHALALIPPLLPSSLRRQRFVSRGLFVCPPLFVFFFYLCEYTFFGLQVLFPFLYLHLVFFFFRRMAVPMHVLCIFTCISWSICLSVYHFFFLCLSGFLCLFTCLYHIVSICLYRVVCIYPIYLLINRLFVYEYLPVD